MDNKEIIEKLKALNSTIEDYLDMMAMDAVDGPEAEEEGEKPKKKGDK